MKPEPNLQPVGRILADNPQVEGLRINTEAYQLEVGFAEAVPEKPGLEEIEGSLKRVLPDPEVVMHSPGEVHAVPGASDAGVPFHHQHLGPRVIEFRRAGGEPRGRVVWRGFHVQRWQDRLPHVSEGPDYRRMLVLSAICCVLGLGGYFAGRAGLAPGLVGALFAGSYVCGGWHAARECLDELRHKRIDVHFLMLLVAIGAIFVDAWSEGAALLFLFSLSSGLEQFAQHRTQKTISSLLKAAPKRAVRRVSGTWVEVAIEEVRTGDELLIKPGELCPVDGRVVEGETSTDESALTGESIPVPKRLNDPVSGGTLNLEGQIVVQVDRLPGESAVQRILALIESAQLQKAPSQRFTDTFSRYYTWAVLGLSGLVFGVLLTLGHPLALAFYRAMTLLVVASPCALVLSIPSAILVAIASGAQRGILFRGGVAVENLARVNQFAFDKTGTLTKGNLTVARILSMNGGTEVEVLRRAASLGQFSTHPLSRAIVVEAERRGLSLDPVTNFQNLPGRGMRAEIQGRTILAGSRTLLKEHDIPLESNAEDHSHVEIWVAADGPLGVIYLSDELRPEARAVVEWLQKKGAGVTLLTGDRPAVANDIATTLGIRDVRAACSPAQKLECIHQWQAQGRKVAMVGDGINDAPSLTAADVAIGMGARGSDAALEQADIVLMHDKIENVAQAVAISRKARAIIQQNLIISLGVVVVLVIAALFNQIGLSLGVLGHEGSTVIVVLNGLRLLRVGGQGLQMKET